ncbi:DeoR/GlpR family DNA-binding transcription regulator [Candidatus Enterococcus clewellii]|uniref:DeoR family transcriptional regulator, carbon catabolite repression regulator n=1 Tax=Candidatus Enterococcus clewellii TaxID=1834193 RepID=A0A242K2P7_9ENTE|nr:DeoR/GlpR family DNA-binding transcription regulator [Enterococcus sp. 9E7_DIV0242]OTP12776.1 hypothetical protein A5888_003355 [Enterococcus sp. 9E7_DIV0242]
MLIEERLAQILAIIDKEQRATIDELAETMHVSKDTIRRDLIRLEQQQLVRRIHGGAVSTKKEAVIFDYNERSHMSNDVKQSIGRQVAELIEDGSSILFDSSTTVEAAILPLQQKKITAITNSLTHAARLAKNGQASITLLPGNLHKEQLFLSGAETVSAIKQYITNYTLLGVFALSPEGVFIHTQEEGLVKREMVKHGQTVIALADHSKMDKIGFFNICPLSDIDILITDTIPEGALLKELEANNIKILTTLKGDRKS